jgi:hypothetical protein
MVGFFPGDNDTKVLNVTVFGYSALIFIILPIIKLLFLIIRVFLRQKYKTHFFTIENISMLLKLFLFPAIAFFMISFILNMATI